MNGLNAQAGADVYAYVADPAGLELPIPGGSETEGGDEIKQAIIYKTATVAPVGDPVATLDAPFGTRRPPVVQAFEEIATGEQFAVVVNHFKSKGCTGAGVDPDTGDGQGCWNQERTQAARTLLDWLATDPTGTGDPDVLVIGDLNAYAMEDPLMVFADAGYTNLAIEYEGAESYSYVYFGQAGSLDHAVASPEIAPQVTGAAIWHINADEPPVLDYNVEFKSANHVTSLYDPGPFRASDHDPVVVGLALSSAAEATATPLPTDTPEPPSASDTPAPTVTDTPEPPASDTPAPTETPPSDDTDSDEDGTPGLVAVIVGLIAVAVAMIGGFLVQRRKR